MYPSSYTSIQDFMLTILALVVIVIFVGAIYACVLAIFQFIFSKWDQEKVKKAWNNIRYTILWIVFSIFLLFLFPILFTKFQIPWYKVYTAKNIFSKAGQLIKIILNTNSNTNSSGTSSNSSDDLQL